MKEWLLKLTMSEDGKSEVVLTGDWNGRLLAGAQRAITKAYKHRKYLGRKSTLEEAKSETSK